MDVNLIMFRGNGERRDIAIKHQKTVLGRSDDADLQIPLATVSRKHCALTVQDDALAVRDLGSSNGTFVNGARVVEATLSAGDKVKIGPVVFTVQIDGAPSEIDANDSMLLSDDAANPVEHENESDLLGLDELPNESGERRVAKVKKPSMPKRVAPDEGEALVRAAATGQEQAEEAPLDLEPLDFHGDVEREAVAEVEVDEPSIEQAEEPAEREEAEDDLGVPLAEADEEEDEQAEEEEDPLEGLPNDPLSALAAMTRKKGDT